MKQKNPFRTPPAAPKPDSVRSRSSAHTSSSSSWVTLFSRVFSTPRLTLFFFLSWLIFLTGFFPFWSSPPGLLQAYRLKKLLAQRTTELLKLQSEIARLESDEKKLTSQLESQAREIRKTLGYLKKDELLFEFREP